MYIINIIILLTKCVIICLFIELLYEIDFFLIQSSAKRGLFVDFAVGGGL